MQCRGQFLTVVGVIKSVVAIFLDLLHHPINSHALDFWLSRTPTRNMVTGIGDGNGIG